MRGKVLWSGCTPYASKDHPRLCGEKIFFMINSSMFLGSPPPMRGKGPVGVFRVRNIGITPAYAGKSNIILCVRITTKDHPRLCGEKLDAASFAFAGAGSPPPMRGKGVWELSLAQVYRITPAYAGKSSSFHTRTI